MSNTTIEILQAEAVAFLQQLIAIPSFSREEQGTANTLYTYLQSKNVAVQRHLNNVWAHNKYYDKNKPTILLNSHHDTVKPNSSYTKDPFNPIIEEGKLFGLGSNDAGGCLVSLLCTFLYFYDRKDMVYNLVFAASAEEEISGANGIESLLSYLGNIDVGIVGEPTQMQMAIAEKGLMVVDCTSKGITGHAARNEGSNAIYNALPDITWFSTYQFPEVSPLLGPVKMNLTIINAGTQHNVIPSECKFTVDIRVNECYTHDDVLEIIRDNVQCDVQPRSKRLKSSQIDKGHPLVVAGSNLGLQEFGSATMSDKALMPFPALKIGPGDSARSHTTDEYIYVNEIKEGIDIYIKILNQLL
jgi:acetylornithine deacetylase